MTVLAKELRDKLDEAVKAAREVAELGARAALEQLAVDAPEPFPHMGAESRELRNRLRAHARQLGDHRDARTGRHGIERLAAECAYEHWHRMLFARFLAENDLLMHSDGVAVSLEECEDLAEHEGAADGWEVAAGYASRMLPQIFRPDAPVLQVRFPPEHQRKLERILADLPPATFTASDALGWVYQFWQAKKKAEVNRSEVKIGADELPAVTQLFTEPYMVDFLLQNTLGAWWVGRHGRESLPVDMPYLRFLEDGTPAAGTLDSWPSSAAEITVLDPCCGSGHFLVAAFHILVRFRMTEEGLSPADACDAVLRDNLHGLEIDERCTQIAAFALALAAWTFQGARGYRILPSMHIACSGLGIRAKKEEWLVLAGADSRLRNGMECLFELFTDAPTLGSLIDPTTVGLDDRQQLIHIARFDELKPLLDTELQSEESQQDFRRRELGVAAQGITAAAELLGHTYTLIVTNVPYLARGKQVALLTTFCERYYDAAKNDLATVFLERILTLNSGASAVVLPQNWLFLASYRSLRERLLTLRTWHLVAQLGEGGFESAQAAGAFTALMIVGASGPSSESAFSGLDATRPREPHEKASVLLSGAVNTICQADQLTTPDARIVLAGFDTDTKLLSSYATAFLGLGTGDFHRFGRFYWEIRDGDHNWENLQTAVLTGDRFGGRRNIVYWDFEIGRVKGMSKAHRDRIHNQDQSGQQAWGRPGVAVALMRDLRVARYAGDVFDKSMAAIIPLNPEHLPAIWCFCTSSEFLQQVRKIDQKVIVANATLVKIPFDLERWQKVADEMYPDGLPEPYSEDPTQWIFGGTIHACTAPLQAAVARFLGYRWPEQVDDGLDDLVDEDGIVCIPAVRGEESAAHRLQALLARAYRGDWSTQKREELLREVGGAGKGLDHWLRHKFFEQHCRHFQHRPFIWHIWDGLKLDGFAALVNYHNLDRKLLETLTYNYLGDWIKRQEDGIRGSVDGAKERLQAARELQKKLELILRGEPPYDIFVRWKPLHEQPMGWEPDLNDGVRINIRPFMTAGVLRHSKPPRLNIKWTKDRGKDSEDAPWYHLGPEYGGRKGDRINEHHLTLEDKRKAREQPGARETTTETQRAQR